jgi:hypothetical protein
MHQKSFEKKKIESKTDHHELPGSMLSSSTAPEEAAVRAKLARLGIGTGKPFDFNALRRNSGLPLPSACSPGATSLTKRYT